MMFKRIYKSLFGRFLNGSLPFESHIISIFLWGEFVLAILSVIENTILNIDPWHNAMQLIMASGCGLTLLFSKKIGDKLIRPLLLISTFIYFPYCFVFNSGVNGTVLLFLMLAMYINAMMFRGAVRICVLIATILYYNGLFLAQYMNPSLFMPYPNELSRIWDYLFSFTACCITLFWITNSFLRAYETERKKANNLVKKLEENNHELENLSIHDPLTGIYNRRHLIRMLEYELSDIRDDANQFCILMMDLDNFKEVNDTYGHGFGDEALISFAKATAERLREYDVFARYGGDEFVVLLPACNPEKAYFIAQRVRQRTEKLIFRIPIHVTVSIGLAIIQPGDTALMAIGRADRQLYLAKQNGRNNVTCSFDISQDIYPVKAV